MSKKELKGCRQSERKIQKTCIKSKYDCAEINEALSDRRENIAYEKGHIPGTSETQRVTNFISY